MSYAVQDNEIKERFRSQWGSTTTIEWPNIFFSPPAISNPPNPATDSWVRFIINNSYASQRTIGAATNYHKYTGVIRIMIFTPLDCGDDYANDLADAACAIFRNWCGTNIVCRQPRKKDVGNEGNGWYQVNVTIQFYRAELH